jgi:hypothetical protein
MERRKVVQRVIPDQPAIGYEVGERRRFRCITEEAMILTFVLVCY